MLIVIYVNDFRYATESNRSSFGYWTGNAWVDARITYLDAQSYQQYGERNYNTSSSAWEGALSAMTDVQIQEIAKDMVDEIRAAKPSPGATSDLSAPSLASTSVSRQEQLEQLDHDGLTYEAYQWRNREIVGQ
ncbi:hypothetical protein ACS8MQ_08740 [Pseudomonas sp. MAHUQ-62]|uniref:hypothetical protein n=1 Tax=Pseudomonas sp. GCM10023245 TaxID=3252652 RepID=UPI00360D16C0